MLKHDAQLRDIAGDNGALSQKLKTLQNREQAFNKMKAELAIERRKLLALSATSTDRSVGNASSTPAVIAANVVPQDVSPTTAETTEPDEAVGTAASTDKDNAGALHPSSSVVTDATQTELDLADELLTRLEAKSIKPGEERADKSSIQHCNTQSSMQSTGDTWASAKAPEPVKSKLQTKSKNLDADASSSVRATPPANQPKSHTKSHTKSEPRATRTQPNSPKEITQKKQTSKKATGPTHSSTRAANKKTSPGAHKSAADESETLFETVDQQDDLKQIFGIGPVTEKTLNKLGITSYSQLATLKKHDIEKIADALHIFPGRIERDNWVGSARRQLEEVLADL